MKAFVLGLLSIATAVFLVLPVEWSPQWGNETIAVLKGLSPVLLVIIGLLGLIIGIADFRDNKQANQKDSKK